MFDWVLNNSLPYLQKINFPQIYLTFKHQPHKIVKHTHTIRRQEPTNCLSVFDHFVGLALEVLTKTKLKKTDNFFRQRG